MGNLSLSENKQLGTYLTETSSPLNALGFFMPWLVLYEVGLLLSGGESTRNLAALWVRDWFHQAGLTQQFLIPLLPCLILLGWHHTTKRPWRITWHYFAAMLLECLVYAVLLFVLFQGQRWLFLMWFADEDSTFAVVLNISKSQIMLAMIGAGIYEEMLFRLILLPVSIGLLTSLGTKAHLSRILGIVLASLLFAAAHSLHQPQEAFTFVFRFVVGVVLSVVFLKRGFGIAVGTHSIYNVAVQVLII